MRGRRAPALATIVALGLSTPGMALAQPKGSSPKPATPDSTPSAQAEPKSPAQENYDRHMENGVRLSQIPDLAGAITEFEAAYAAVPSAGPLLNQGFAYRKMGKYPKALATLESALAQYRGTMSSDDLASAEQAISEMRPLLGFVVVKATPANATITVDGEPVPTSLASKPIPVSPGTPKVEVSAPGYESHSESRKVPSKETWTLEVVLKPTTGRLVIKAKRPTTVIEIDGRPAGKGTFEGELPVGPHTVRAVGESRAGNVSIEPGKPTEVDLKKNPDALPALPAPPEPEGPVHGLYGAVGGAVLVPFKHPVFFSAGTYADSGASSGGYVDLRGGYRVHDFAAFEGKLEYGNVVGPRNGAGEQSYSLTSVHFGPILRLMSPGKVFKFVGTLGGGFAYHQIGYEGLDDDLEQQACPQTEECGSSGVDFFALTEAGVELDLEGVLIGLTGVFFVTGTKGMNDFSKNSPDAVDASFKEPYANELLPMAGPRLYAGYAFW